MRKKWIGLLLCLLATASVAQQAKRFTIAANSVCVSISAQNNSTVGIIVSGTWTGTLTPTLQISGVSGAPTVSTTVTPTNSTTSQATITVNGGYKSPTGGFTTFNLCSTAWSSGTATIDLFGTQAVNAGLLGSASGGPPSGPAGGDLSGNYPNPTIVNIAGPTVTISSAGNGNAVLALSGTTSGTATLTAPAVAGTATNPIVVSNSVQLASGNSINWNADTYLGRASSGIFNFGTASGGTTGTIKAAGWLSSGTKFTTNAGCGESAGTTTGGATAGKFTTSGSTSCTTIVTFGNAQTSPTGWDCHILDLTTAADFANPHESSSTTTTVTFVSGTIVASDVLQFSCIGY